MLSQKLLSFSLLGTEWVLWVLIALSVVSIATLAERALLFWRTREDLRRLEAGLSAALATGDVSAALAEVQGDGMSKNVLRAGLDSLRAGRNDPGSLEQAMLGAMARERARFESRLTLLGTVGNNAPFVGLFGTVLGIILAFNQLGRLDPTQASSNQFVMAAISEALVATGVGIAVAIPAVAAFNWAKSAVAARLKNAETLMRALLAGAARFSAQGS